MDYETMWNDFAATYPKPGTIVGERKAFDVRPGCDTIIYCNPTTGCGAWFTCLVEWDEYVAAWPIRAETAA